MKKFIIISSIVLALIALGVFNKMTSKSKVANVYTEVKRGTFEITVAASGELLAEKALDIFGPVIGEQNNDRGGGRGQGGQPSHGGGGGGDMRSMMLKIQDIVPEGTIVKKGDYIAQLDKSAYDNSLKDALEELKTYQTNLDMKVLDTALALTGLRDDIKNQRYAVEEAAIFLAQSKYEPPATIRKAEMSLDRAKRSLEQKVQSYDLRIAQNLSEIDHEKLHLTRGSRLVEDLQNFLGNFTVTAPADGMVIYKKERNGTKRKTGSSLNPFDMVIATLPDLSSMLSKVYVNEIDISKITENQKVEIKVDAFPEKSYTGQITTIANVGEQLPNSDSKLFEVLIKIAETDPSLRPSMTTGNKIIIKTFEDVTYIPSESVRAGSDSIPFVYQKNKTKQIVVLGESNDKNVIVDEGLKPGTSIFLMSPENPETFKLAGETLIPIIKERIKVKKAENQVFRKDV